MFTGETLHINGEANKCNRVRSVGVSLLQLWDHNLGDSDATEAVRR